MVVQNPIHIHLGCNLLEALFAPVAKHRAMQMRCSSATMETQLTDTTRYASFDLIMVVGSIHEFVLLQRVDWHGMW